MSWRAKFAKLMVHIHTNPDDDDGCCLRPFFVDLLDWTCC
jgi:hypothetical protein